MSTIIDHKLMNTDRNTQNVPSKRELWLTRCEYWLMAVLLVLLLGLHVTLLLNAGGLWRDEVGTVQVANMSSLGEVGKNIQHESFPILWHLVLRAWTTISGGSDSSYRLLGYLMGMGIVGGLLWNARQLRISAPLISLLLLTFNPVVIRYGDSMRAYGFGITMFLVTFGIVWKVVSQPTLRTVIGATIAAVLSVHVLYYNSVLLLALCAGGAAVAMRHKQWDRIGLLFGLGIVAAISLLPYASTIRESTAWNDLIRIPHYNLSWFWMMLSQALGSSEHNMVAVWTGLFCIGTAVGTGAQIRPQWLRATPEQRDLGLFCVVSSLVGMLGYFVFLKVLSYPTQPWYYITLLALIAINLEGLFSLLANLQTGRLLRLLIVLLVVATTFRTTVNQTLQRHTNVDLITARIEREATKDDFILVNSWALGIPFDYYYKGATPWMTLPPINDHRFHRYDLVKKQMRLNDQTLAVRPVLERMEATLKSGRRVWFVGGMMLPQQDEEIPIIVPRQGLTLVNIHMAWSRQVRQFIHEHATLLYTLAVPVGGEYENIPFFKAEGWQER